MARPFGPSMIEQIRLGYADLDTTLDETADRLGINRGTIVNLARKCGWPKRRAASAALRRPASPTPEPNEREGANQDPLALLDRISARAIASLDADLSAGRSPDPERAARAVSIHVRTQQSLKKLQDARAEEPQVDDEPPPRSLSELRDELRRHLERIRSERRSRELRGHAEPG
jgi:hypothetical protein